MTIHIQSHLLYFVRTWGASEDEFMTSTCRLMIDFVINVMGLLKFHYCSHSLTEQQIRV